MDIEKYEAMIEKSEIKRHLSQIERLIFGLQIISIHIDNSYPLSARHDTVSCDGPAPDKSTWDDDNELMMLASYGWTWDKGFDCWEFLV